MQSDPANRSTRGWYTVSVDTVRGAVIVASFAALALAGYGLYRQWGEKALQQEAAAVLREVERLLADNRLAKELLDWEPKVRFEDGLQLTVDWLRNNLGRYRPDVYNV